jgi:hypothetical protein
VAYSYLDDLAEWLKRLWRAPDHATPPA